MRDKTNPMARHAVIVYDAGRRQFVFSARQWNNETSSYICQLHRGIVVL